jgi:hypothetical protein
LRAVGPLLLKVSRGSPTRGRSVELTAEVVADGSSVTHRVRFGQPAETIADAPSWLVRFASGSLDVVVHGAQGFRIFVTAEAGADGANGDLCLLAASKRYVMAKLPWVAEAKAGCPTARTQMQSCEL